MNKPFAMQKINFVVSILILIFSFSIRVWAQNPASVDVQSLSDQQIQQIVNEVNTRGLTIDQAAQLAQAQGASALQVEQVKRRIQELQAGKGDSIANPAAVTVRKSEFTREAFSEKAKVDVTEETKRIFGFQLFNSENLTFEPSVNIPAPKNYTLGVGDELLIKVWGASQQTYQVKIDLNGAINIPDIGPVFLSGMEYFKAEERIKKRLYAIYHGMEGPNPNTYADVSINGLRSIKVNIIGEVMAPGTYALPATASAFNALYLSGGPNENGTFRSIQLIRDNKIIKTIDVYDYLINANTQNNIQLREQDMIYIPTYQKRVDANGAFKRTGIFELNGKETVKDLIRYLGGFSDNAFLDQLSVTRITGTEKKIMDVPQSAFESFMPANGDIFTAGTIIDRFENRVTISGAVFRPGTYELTPELTLSALMKKARGVKENYYSNRGQILRLQENLAPQIIAFDVSEVLNGTSDIQLQREDQVIIQDIFSMREPRFVQVFGQVQQPGKYEFTDNMTLNDLIFQAGGLMESASESYVELSRRLSYEEAAQESDELVKLFQFSIDRELKLDKTGEQFLIQPFDNIYIRQAPSYHIQRTVSISGEVRYPGSYSISNKNERIADLINRCGGFTSGAFIPGAQMLRGGTRLEIQLDEIMKNPGSIYDYFLKEGDQLIIPEISQEVTVLGEILNPFALAYESGKNVRYYINKTGGFNEKAKPGKLYVIYTNGTTRVTKNFIIRNYPRPEPGCQIMVPQKIEKQKTDQTAKWLGIASTLSSIALVISYIIR